MRNFLSIVILGILIISCKHDPFPYDGPIDDPNDTTIIPIDTCDPNIVYFNDVYGIFAGCAIAGCHDDISHKDGINLTVYDSIVFYMLKPSKPTEWDETKLYEVLVENDPKMPPAPYSSLTSEEIQLLKDWVEQGSTDEECGGCDTVNVTYTNHINPMYIQNCKSCHFAGNTISNIDLNNYTLFKYSAQSVLKSMKLNPGDQYYMPQSRPKNDCNVTLMELWINDNTPE